MAQLIRRHLAAGIAAILFTSTALEACTRASAQAPAPEAPAVPVPKPLTRMESDWSEQSGRFVAMATVDVRPRVSGYLTAIHFTDGQVVQKGRLLFTIDPQPFEARVARARAELAQAEAQLERTRSELKRAETLRA